MKCMACGYFQTRVYETKAVKAGDILRRRECPKCHTRFRSVERALRIVSRVVAGERRSEERRPPGPFAGEGRAR